MTRRILLLAVILTASLSMAGFSVAWALGQQAAETTTVMTVIDPDRVVTIPGQTHTFTLPISTTTVTVTASGTTTTTAPPPPPASSWSKGGTGLWSPGNSIPSSAANLDVVIAADWNSYQIKDFPAPTLSLIYQSILSADQRTDRFYGMTAQEVIANGWYLRDISGNPVFSSGYPNSVLADVGLQAFQDKWAQNVIAFLTARGMDGLQIDDVVAQLSGYAAVAVPKYPTAQVWEDAMVSAISNVGAKLKAQGFYVLPNVFKSGGAANTAAFALRMKVGLHGVMLESFTATSSQLSATSTLLQVGIDVIGLDFTNSASVKSQLLALGGRALYMTG